MWPRIKSILSNLLLLLSLVAFLILGESGLTAQPAWAEIRQIEEAPGQLLYQSRNSLRDPAGYSWQVVLFKQVKDATVRGINLRLVGFPGVADFSHPKPLQIKIETGEIFTAEDEFADKSPAPNVGQYDFKSVLLKLPVNQRIVLLLPIADDRTIALQIPPSIILEWQTLAQN
ncbi:DUF3122 domain-containing protein [Phormidium pseudopriestleyi FRX01]|uniref:DUF3122 domain-containing protein n=1 Tax=Phormidium pseudopriestleyi FRX01 TaxID=1759528 RepID=A0ABS3FTH0_9CYAN|nr:DUF3122 domain-containing protein [Phormidium pseudopriestleyi]MBO0350353.1 DUF3122 domain-containing protein [Phormidium pseudopriestleyi FRX01]